MGWGQVSTTKPPEVQVAFEKLKTDRLKRPVRHERDCSNCRFFAPITESDRGLGVCHRYPDGIDKLDADWCGEWKWVLS